MKGIGMDEKEQGGFPKLKSLWEMWLDFLLYPVVVWSTLAPQLCPLG